MSKDLKNKVDSIRRTLKNNSLEVSATVIESKILELYPNHQTDWNSDVRAEVIKSVTNDYKLSQTISAIAPIVDTPPAQRLTQIQRSEIFAEEELEEEELTEIYEEDEEVNAIAPLEHNQAGELATVEDKSELVASTAQSMGIELQLSEIQNIASNIDYSGDSLDESIADIRAAITTFVEYKAQVNQQKINHMITEVRATVNQRNQETSQHLNNGLGQIAKDIKEADTDFKSQVKSALQYFAIPTNKAS